MLTQCTLTGGYEKSNPETQQASGASPGSPAEKQASHGNACHIRHQIGNVTGPGANKMLAALLGCSQCEHQQGSQRQTHATQPQRARLEYKYASRGQQPEQHEMSNLVPAGNYFHQVKQKTAPACVRQIDNPANEQTEQQGRQENQPVLHLCEIY